MASKRRGRREEDGEIERGRGRKHMNKKRVKRERGIEEGETEDSNVE